MDLYVDRLRSEGIKKNKLFVEAGAD